MRADFNIRSDLTVRLDDENWENGKRCENMIEVLCRDYGCERIGFPYSVGAGYKAQDIMSRKVWRWYTIEYNTTEYKLRYRRIVRFRYKLLTPEMLMRQGIPADRNSLGEMGLRIRSGKIYVRGNP